MTAFQPDPTTIQWRLHLRSSPQDVYNLIASSAGRARFWAESAEEQHGVILFRFPGGIEWAGRILANIPFERFSVQYYGNTVATFTLDSDGIGGTDLTLTDMGVFPQYRTEVSAGWVSVLMSLKATADFNIDLRNHDPKRTWNQGFVEN